ncbi:hypothetical protein BT63DRAFT_412390 [Microthyrium microscopicum]|uniref:SRR1-like domain-containing protein n=1 Tax=Microthyrium microscopicum TaxID=703497 RepID=A0A6A6UKC9_9PEZI|nr:hypothetical protein BT63DRAFT_412390 [Microthyrium microscopicum]
MASGMLDQVEKSLTDPVFKLYESGIPMYPRSSINEMIDEINHIDKKKPTIEVKQWDGRTTTYPNNPGKNKRTHIEFVRIQEVLGNPGQVWPLRLEYDNDENNKTVNYEKAKKQFYRLRDMWERSDVAKTIKSNLLRYDGCKLTGVIGLALGSFAKLGSPLSNRSLTQLAALLYIAKILNENQGRHDIPVYVQEPCFSSDERLFIHQIGKQVMSDLNGTDLFLPPPPGHLDLPAAVVNHPDGLMMIDAATVVLSISPDIAIKSFVADDIGYLPAVFITDRPPSAEQMARIPPDMLEHVLNNQTDPETKRWRDVVATRCTKIPLPEYEDGFTGVDMIIRN